MSWIETPLHLVMYRQSWPEKGVTVIDADFIMALRRTIGPYLRSIPEDVLLEEREPTLYGATDNALMSFLGWCVRHEGTEQICACGDHFIGDADECWICDSGRQDCRED